MAVSIRLRREGTKNRPFYRVVVADKRSPRDGKFIEAIGKYDPQAPEEVLVRKVEQGRKVIFKVEMRKADVGKVIGRNGHTITAMRNVLNAAASRSGQSVVLQIVE